jgi:hypothetical protein
MMKEKYLLKKVVDLKIFLLLISEEKREMKKQFEIVRQREKFD